MEILLPKNLQRRLPRLFGRHGNCLHDENRRKKGHSCRTACNEHTAQAQVREISFAPVPALFRRLAPGHRRLPDDGHDLHPHPSGREAMKMAGRESFDLFMLDWQVPDVSGAEVLMWLRANVSKSVPVLFVTVRDSEQDIVFALEHGADDYMIKPVRRQELLARVHALLRRAYPSEEKKQMSFPPFEIDTARNEVRKDGTAIELTPKEFELTVTLFRNIGRLMSRGHLQETVWGRTGDLATRTVDTHVSQVRKKLDLRPESGYRVVPIYNYGYRLEKIPPPG
jgi:DNA-binding response OmpR family regulator